MACGAQSGADLRLEGSAVAQVLAHLDRVAGNRLVPTGTHNREAYEDIARDPVSGHLYLLIEAAERNGGYMARVEEYDPALRFLSAGWLEFPLPVPVRKVRPSGPTAALRTLSPTDTMSTPARSTIGGSA